jgi:hypothetical protein
MFQRAHQVSRSNLQKSLPRCTVQSIANRVLIIDWPRDFSAVPLVEKLESDRVGRSHKRDMQARHDWQRVEDTQKDLHTDAYVFQGKTAVAGSFPKRGLFCLPYAPAAS